MSQSFHADVRESKSGFGAFSSLQRLRSISGSVADIATPLLHFCIVTRFCRNFVCSGQGVLDVVVDRETALSEFTKDDWPSISTPVPTCIELCAISQRQGRRRGCLGVSLSRYPVPNFDIKHVDL